MAQYTVKTPDGGQITVEGPDNASDADIIRNAQALHAQRLQARDAQTKAYQQEEAQRFQQAEADRPWAQRAAENVGAGMDTLYQGGKQLVRALSGRSGKNLGDLVTGGNAEDEAIQEKRLRDQALANTTTGGGLMQTAGEILPTLAIPAGAATGALRALPMVGRLLPRAGSLASATIDAAAMGGAAGAAQPVLSTESRGENAAMGAAGGALAPAGFSVLRKAGSYLTRGGAAQRAAKGLSEAAPGAENALRGAAPSEIPLTTAAAAQSPELAVAERSSRAKQPAAWAQNDADRSAAVWDQVDRATSNADDLGALRAVRSSNWSASTANAMNAVKPEVFKAESDAFRQLVDQAAQSPEGLTTMRPALEQIKTVMDSPAYGPQHLAQLRKLMGQSMNGPVAPGTLSDRAIRQDPLFMSLKNAMDDVLNKSTGNAWDKVNTDYAAQSMPVKAARASEGIRNTFLSPEGVSSTANGAGVPQVTGARLSQAMKRYGEDNFGDTLMPGSRGRLQKTLDALQQQQITQRVRNTATAGGGSDTASNLAQMAEGPVSRVMDHATGGMYGALRDLVAKRGDRLLQEETQRLLQNPQQYLQAMNEMQRLGIGMTGPQQELMKLISQTGAGAAPALLTQ